MYTTKIHGSWTWNINNSLRSLDDCATPAVLFKVVTQEYLQSDLILWEIMFPHQNGLIILIVFIILTIDNWIYNYCKTITRQIELYNYNYIEQSLFCPKIIFIWDKETIVYPREKAIITNHNKGRVNYYIQIWKIIIFFFNLI